MAKTTVCRSCIDAYEEETFGMISRRKLVRLAVENGDIIPEHECVRNRDPDAVCDCGCNRLPVLTG